MTPSEQAKLKTGAHVFRVDFDGDSAEVLERVVADIAGTKKRLRVARLKELDGTMDCAGVDASGDRISMLYKWTWQHMDAWHGSRRDAVAAAWRSTRTQAEALEALENPHEGLSCVDRMYDPRPGHHECEHSRIRSEHWVRCPDCGAWMSKRRLRESLRGGE